MLGNQITTELDLQKVVTVRLKDAIDPDYDLYDYDDEEEFGVDGCDMEIVDSKKAGWQDVLLTGELRNLLDSDKALVRIAIAEAGLALDILINDPCEDVRIAVAKQQYGLNVLINDPHFRVRCALVYLGCGIDILVNDPDSKVRKCVAECGHHIEKLKNDTESIVRYAALNYERAVKAKTSTRFINDDFVAKSNSLRAAKISQEELKSKIMEITVGDSWFDKMKQDSSEYRIQGWAVRAVFRKANKDNIYRLGDNIHSTQDLCACGHMPTNHLLGWHTLENGLSFCGFLVDNNVWDVGDTGTFAVVYFDGKQLRSYTPVCGNDINLKYKTSLGSEAHVLYKNDYKKYQEAGSSGEAAEMCDAYLAKYDLTRNTLVHNWDAIKKELETVFKIK